MKYCLNCDWFASVEDGLTEAERSKLAIEHFVETGHAIDSSDSLCRPMPPAVCEDLLVGDLASSVDGTD
ncbi:hypothetical protein [Natronococcus wangiae]|uniref:hypothetical protein n=1 Tax=Natronococcus wangiae TaxID=3068275 RepID=UPI00273D0FCE|nr:hypothetical protein [Natronococcus sp. AD5]